MRIKLYKLDRIRQNRLEWNGRRYNLNINK